MTQEYQQTATAAPFGAIAACSGLNAGTTVDAGLCEVGGTPGSTELVADHPGSGSGTLRLIHFELDVDAGTDWDAGNWTVRMGVTTQSSQLIWDSVFICRVDSGGVSQEELASDTGLGIKFNAESVSTVVNQPSAATPNAGDRVYIVIGCTNNQTMSNTVGITPSDTITAPFTAGGTTGTLAVTQDDQTSSASGTLEHSGTLAETQADQTATASGTLEHSGSLAETQADQTSSASGTSGGGGGGASIPSSPFARYLASDLSGTHTDDDPVTAWADASGNGHDLATVGSGSTDPIYRSADFGPLGSPCVEFSNASTALALESAAFGTALSPPGTWVWIGEWITVVGTAVVITGSTDQWLLFINSSEVWNRFAGTVDASTVVPAADTPYVVAASYRDDAAAYLWINDTTEDTGSTGGGNLDRVRMNRPDNDFPAAVRTAEVILYDRELDATELSDLFAYYEATYITSGSTGSLSETQDNQTLSASGTVTAPPVTGSLAETQDAQAATASGTLSHTGTVAATQADQTLSATGTVGDVVNGTLDIAQDAQTSTASGTLGHDGTLDVTEADDTLAASGTLSHTGSISETQADQTLSASGVVGDVIAGSVAETQDDHTLAASGQLGHTGTLSAAQADHTLSAAGDVEGPVLGSLAATQDAQTATATGWIEAVGTLAITQDDQTLATSGVLGVTGTLAEAQEAQTLSAAGTAILVTADLNPIKLSFREPSRHLTHRESRHVTHRESRHVTYQEG